MSSVAEIKRDVLTKPGRYTVFKDNLHAKEVIVGDGERRKHYILCYNPKEAARYDGKWVLETNDDTISLEDAACGYKGLMIIERCFRSLKRTQIKLMPMYHWATRRIESHIKICMLALLIERVAELDCGKPWHQIKRILDGLQITEFFSLNYRVLMRNELTEKVRNILKSLKINPTKKVIDLQKTT